jgi:hypothetical protein
MHQVIIKQTKERIRVDMELEGVNYQLWRLDDIEYSKLRQHSMPIKDADFWLYRSLSNYRDAEQNKFNLAKLFVVLEYKFGKSSNYIDTWKGSFSFPLLLVIEKTETFYYMMDISDHRGWVEFRLYKIVMEGISDKDKFGNSVYKDPFEAEFSRDEIDCFICHFYGYLVGYFRAVKKTIQIKPFLNKIDSNFILYGYEDNNYFEKGYDNEEAYKAAIQSFEDKYTIVPESSICDAIIKEIVTVSHTTNG